MKGTACSICTVYGLDGVGRSVACDTEVHRDGVWWEVAS